MGPAAGWRSALWTDPAGGIAGWPVDLMETLGGPGAGLAIALENLFPPLPSEVILPLAGFTASQGELSLAGAIGWTTAGSVVGALALYLLGAWFGRDRVRALAARTPLVKLSDVERAEAWFGRHGGKAVLIGRFVPVVRSLISIPAGVERMPVWKFVGLTGLGSLLWNSLFILAGYQLGEHWFRVEAYVSAYQGVMIGLAVLASAVVARRLVRRYRSQQAN
ncbi:MAG TPA: DedA family protein [Natronosporangium sp.]